MESWASKYRPRKLTDIVGQTAVKVVLAAMVKKDQVPSAMLFAGSYGSGKTSTARILAAALNCEQESKPCGECASCQAVFAGNSINVIEIDAASNGGVAEIRALSDFLSYATLGRRVVLLDEVQSMSRAAYDALLKTLEEPPPNTVFILLTTEPTRIAKTIMSRLMLFQFDKIPFSGIVGQLRRIALAEAVEVPDELLALIGHSAQGSLRDAVMKLDQCARADILTVEAYRELYSEYDFAPELISKLAKGDAPGAMELLDAQVSMLGEPAHITAELINTFKDLIILSNGGQINWTGASLAARQAVLPLIGTDHMVLAMKILWDLKTRLSAIEDSRAMLNLACVMIMDAIGPRLKSTPSIAPPNKSVVKAAPSGALSLEQMRAMASEQGN